MKTSITAKLFFAILAANVVVAIAVGVATRVSFNEGFVDYVSARETQRLRDLADVIAAAYRENGSWDFLRDNVSLWMQLNAPRFPGGGRAPDGERARPRFDADGEPPRRTADPRPSPPHDADFDHPKSGSDTGATPLSREFGGPARKGPPERPPLARISDSPGGPKAFPSARRRDVPPGGMMSGLLDEAKKPIVGNTTIAADSVLQPVVVDGHTVGWLTGNFVSAPLRDLDRRFQDKQRSAMWVIGAIAVALSTIVALLLARGLLAPVKRLATATHRLAAGDYATRVPPSSRDELGQLSEDFNQLALALERTERMRRNFMADISHELRTPLAVLRGELEGLQDGIRTLTPAALASLQAEVATLHKLIDDLYDLSLADVGALAYRKESLELVSALERALQAFRIRLDERRIAVQTRYPSGESLVIDADSARMTQLFNNLIENTVRYTDPNGTLRITAARVGNRVRLLFEDSPPGVPDELLPRLFERLFRVDGSRSRASGGAGLGLSLCQSIVEAHGGEIRARGSELGGVCIEIEFPLARGTG